jgi:hypothetical protein
VTFLLTYCGISATRNVAVFTQSAAGAAAQCRLPDPTTLHLEVFIEEVLISKKSRNEAGRAV